MKRFLLFVGQAYYPHGGFNDFFGSFDTLEEAVQNAQEPSKYGYCHDWAHIIDSEKGVVVYADEYSEYNELLKVGTYVSSLIPEHLK